MGQEREGGGGAARFVETDFIECRAFLTTRSADFLRFSALELGYQIMREKERMCHIRDRMRRQFRKKVRARESSK